MSRDYRDFKRGVIFSVSAHLVLIILLMISPHFPKNSSKGMVHYVNVISFPGGGGGSGGGGMGGAPGGGGGGGEKAVATPVPARERLSDLTTPQRLIQQKPASMRFPVERPKRERKPPEEKRTVIQRRSNTPASGKGTEEGTGEEGAGGGGGGGGLRMGIGGSGGGGGWGGGGSSYSSQIGLSSFPYTYYLQTIHGRISSNWFTSQVRAGVSGKYHTTVFFKITRDGRIDGLKIEEGSGIRALDLSARRAIESSAPFPPLPREYEDEYLGIHLIFEHTP